jgi:anthranilate synthase component 1
MMQVQIGQRLTKRYTESPLSLYRALRSLNPSPYMFFYDFGEFQVVGASPEILVRQEHTPAGDKVTIRRSRARGRAARRPSRTRRSRPSSSAIRRSAPST